MSRDKEHRPHGAAAEGGRPIGAPPKAAPVCLMDILMDIYGYIINIYGSEVGGVSPTGKSLVSCAASGCGRRGASCRWVARRQHVLLLRLLRSFSLVFSRWILSPTPNPPYQPQAGLIGIPYIFHIYFLDMFHVFSLVCFLIYGVKRRQVLIAKPRFYF